MGTVEIVLLVIGIICVIVGIILGITDNNDHDKDMNPAVSDYDAASQVSKVSQTIDNIIEQKMQDIEDKTEARLDKLSNTKILEMNEYCGFVHIFPGEFLGFIGKCCIYLLKPVIPVLTLLLISVYYIRKLI